MDETKKLTRLESVLQYTFTDTNLLRLAMTHSSYAHEYLADPDFYNERIEFLGDAVLELAVSNTRQEPRWSMLSDRFDEEKKKKMPFFVKKVQKS